MTNKAGLLQTAILLSAILILPGPSGSMARKPAQAEPIPLATHSLPSLGLNDCYELALERSERVAIRKEEIEEAEAQFFKAAGEALGDINFIMTDFRQDAPKARSADSSGSSVGGTLSKQHRRERHFIITQPLFQGFKSLGALTGAGSFRKQRVEERLRSQELLFLDVATTFYQVLRYQKDVKIIEEAHDLLVERIKELSAREAIGRSRLSEVATARARTRTVDAELARSRGTLMALRHLLEFLTGISIEPEQLTEEDLPEEARNLASYLEGASRRADVEAAKHAMKTARRGVVVAQSALWPEITLENNLYDRREGFQAGFDWDLLLKLDLPLFKGGDSYGKLKEAVSRSKKAKLTYTLTKREAELDIKTAFQDWLTSRDEFRALEEAVKSSEENFRLQREDYSRNLVSNLDVLEALESLQDVRREANQATYEMKENFWHLKVAAGEIS